MSNDNNYNFENLTFSQRWGYEPLPDPMQLESLSDDLRREIWNFISRSLLKIQSWGYITYPLQQILGKIYKLPEDHFSKSSFSSVSEEIKREIISSEFNRVLDIIEVIVNNIDVDPELANQIHHLFEQYSAPYSLEKYQHKFRFSPRASKEQGEATSEAIETINKAAFDGAATHIQQAREHINHQQYADSIIDSIHAVESVACLISSRDKPSLNQALAELENVGILIHPALKEAFLKLYGYSSNEQGIRHALLEKKSPEVGLDEAMFMYGACASFVAYLINKHRKLDKERKTTNDAN